MTSLSAIEYFKNHSTWAYLKNILLYPVVFDLPGLFFSEFTHGLTVNGSLWTLRYEFTLYLLVAFAGYLSFLKKRNALIAFSILFFVSLLETLSMIILYDRSFLHYMNLGQMVEFSILFLSGTLFYFYQKNIKYNRYGLFFSASILFLFLVSGEYFKLFFPILGSYILFFFAQYKHIKFHNFAKYGDFSYGIYIYGFPVQQILIRLNQGQMSPEQNFFMSIPIAIILGYLSWHLIEKRALNFARRG